MVTYPAAIRQAAEVVRDPRVHTIPADLPPGGYRLILEAEATRVELGEVAVVR